MELFTSSRLRKRVAGFELAVLMVILFLGSVAHAITRGYTTEDAGLQTGMVVSLSTSNGSDEKIERASQDSSTRVVGIATTVDESLVTVSSGATKVFVESEGAVDAYVSSIQGEIKKGDLLVVSPFNGILMKANSVTPSTVIAIAAEKPISSIEYTYQDEGSVKQTQISKIKVNLNRQGGTNGVVQSDSALARLGRSLVGRDVGETRVAVAMIIFVIVLIAEGGILYGAISSAITALGRNPLARKIIRTELIRVVLIAVLVLGLGLGAVYAVLWV